MQPVLGTEPWWKLLSISIQLNNRNYTYEGSGLSRAFLLWLHEYPHYTKARICTGLYFYVIYRG
jgi:hypothetical protein